MSIYCHRPSLPASLSLYFSGTVTAPLWGHLVWCNTSFDSPQQLAVAFIHSVGTLAIIIIIMLYIIIVVRRVLRSHTCLVIYYYFFNGTVSLDDR